MFPKYLEPCRGLVMISGYSRFSGLENKFKRYLGGRIVTTVSLLSCNTVRHRLNGSLGLKDTFSVIFSLLK